MVRRRLTHFYSCAAGACARKQADVPFAFTTVICSSVAVQVVEWVAQAAPCHTAASTTSLKEKWLA